MMENNNNHHPAAAAAKIEICCNCSVPLVNLLDDIESSSSHLCTSSSEFKVRNKVTEITITNLAQSENSTTTTTTTISVNRALSSIFKLKYLSAFSQEEAEEEEEELSLCHDCSEVLTQLYSLFNFFVRLQQLDSSLAHRIEKLDDIIDRHHQHKINCDLISVSLQNCNDFDGKPGTTTIKTKNIFNESTPSNQTDTHINSKSRVHFDLEPRVILTRLPTSYLSPPPQQEQQQILEEDAEDSGDDAFFEAIVKTEFDEDSTHDDDDELSDPLLIKSEESDPEWTAMVSSPISQRRLNKKQQPKKITKQTKGNKRKASSSSSSTESLPSDSDDAEETEDLDPTTSSKYENDEVVKRRIRRPKEKLQQKPPETQASSKYKRAERTVFGEKYLYKRAKAPNPCYYCNLDFPTIDLCVEHTKKDHQSKMTPSSLVCLRCSKICVNETWLNVHRKKCELVPSGVILPFRLKCPECPKEFVAHYKLRDHLSTHSNNRPFPCDKCEYRGHNVVMLKKHVRWMHRKKAEQDDDDPSNEEKTEGETQTPTDITKMDGRINKTYLRRRAVVPNPCHYCPLDFPTLELCLKHTKENHRSKMTRSSRLCSRCSIICRSNRGLAHHLRRCKLMPSGVILSSGHKCPHCPIEYTTQYALDQHIPCHAKDWPFCCDKCNYRGKSAVRLQMHQQKIHCSQEDIIYMEEESRKCDECDTVCVGVKKLKSHKYLMHTAKGRETSRRNRELQKIRRREKIEQASTVCSQCNVDFFSQIRLTLHRKTDHFEQIQKRYVCHLCGIFCLSPRSLRSHIARVHSDSRPFLCQECGKDFKCKNGLSIHLEFTHTEEGRLKNNAKAKEKNRRSKLLRAQLEKLQQQAAVMTGDS